VKSRPQARFIGINVDDTLPDARDYTKRYGWTWPSLQDPNRALAGKLGAAWQPVVVLVNPKGEIAGVHIGPGTAKAWGELLRKAMADP
jgi:cytochrome c biogenesis protein CcmG, thiol:disulfide interchange protein DsbE